MKCGHYIYWHALLILCSKEVQMRFEISIEHMDDTEIVEAVELVSSDIFHDQPGKNAECSCQNICEVSPSSENTDGAGIIGPRIISPPKGVVCPNGGVYCCGTSSCGKRFLNTNNVSQAGYTRFGEFPWQVIISLKDSSKYVSTGALISNRHILTTAHNIYDYANEAENLKVILGEWDTSSSIEPVAPIEADVRDVLIHPEFNQKNFKNDLAILLLDNRLKLKDMKYVNTICMPSYHDNRKYEKVRCWVSGWGLDAMYFDKKHTDNIQKAVDLMLVPNEECERRLRRTRLGSKFILDSKSFICAGGEMNKDACKGDGGAPLVCENPDGSFTLLGLVSWGIGCGQAGVPGVYVNISNYIQWIYEQTSQPAEPKEEASASVTSVNIEGMIPRQKPKIKNSE